MTFLTVVTKDKLPNNINLECPVCLNLIDLDKLDDDGVPNSVICDNGHRLHFHCFRGGMNHQCPVCRNTHMRFCKSQFGYLCALRESNYHSSEHN